MADELNLGPASPRAELGGPETDRVAELERRLARVEADAEGPRRVVQVHPGTVLTVLGVTAFALALVALLLLAWGAITLVLIAVFFAIALNPAVDFFVRRGWRRGLAATTVFLLAFLLLAAIITLAGPPLVKQVRHFVDGLPELSRGQGPLGVLERKYHVVENIEDAVTKGDYAKNLALGVAATGIGVIVVSFLSFFMLLEGRSWVERLLNLAPDDLRPRVERVGQGVYQAVGGFVTGNLVASALGGTLATIVLLATGIPYAIPLGLLVAFLDLIPILGAILAPIMLGLVALTQGVVPAIIVVGAFFIYHQIEVYYLRPLIYGRAVELSPLAVLVAIVIGTELAGLLGTLAAIPVAAGIQVVLAEVGDARSSARHQEIIEPTGSVSRPGA